MGALLPWGKRYCVSSKATQPQARLTDLRFIVDSTDHAALPVARDELQDLLSKPSLDSIPLLVLGNKSDLPTKLSVDDLIETLDLKKISHRELSCYGISAKEETNLDAVLQWLIGHTGK